MYKVALGAVLLLFIHMWVKEVLREEENNEKRKEGLLSIISTDGELQKQIDIIRKYRHDIPCLLYTSKLAFRGNATS